MKDRSVIPQDEETLLPGDFGSGAAHPDPAPASPDGRVLADRYRILGVLGQGGMGTVYRVRDLALDEVVALKTLRRDWIAAPGALDRFLREVKLARRVTHPNVARTYDLGEHDGEPFLTMELIEGRSLAREIEAVGPLPVARATGIAARVVEGLVAAHAVGVVHRDLKPDNVLLGPDGRVAITDFGIARVEAGDASATGAGAVLGTPAYMSPEQVQALPVDGRSDVYALGLVLYEMLTGHRAFDGATPLAVATARLVRPPPDPRRLAPATPESIAQLTLRLLAREPEQRPPLAEVLAALTSETAEIRARVVAPQGRSLAVYPLRNAGPPEDRWIGEGLTDDLFDALCTVPGLRMKARTASLPGETPHDHARRVGVELLLEGSVRRADDQVRLVLRLTAVADGFQVWADRVDCRVGELLSVSDRVANDVARAAGHGRAEPATRAAAESGAIELYLRAREIQRDLAFSWRDAAALLARAHDIAPDDPTVAAYYAEILSGGLFDPQEPGEDRAGTARRAAERALDLAPHLAEPWYAVARVRYNTGDTSGALRALRRALENGPSLAPAHDLVGRILTELDRLDEARACLDRALAVDPALGFAITDLVRIAAFRSDFDRALGLLPGLSPEFETMASMRLSLWLRRVVMRPERPSMGPEVDELLEVVQAAASGAPLTPAWRARVEAFVGLTPGLSRPSRFMHQVAAEVYLCAGDEVAGAAHVRHSVAAGLEDLAWLRHCPLLVPLHARGLFTGELATVERRAADIGRAWDQSGVIKSAG